MPDMGVGFSVAESYLQQMGFVQFAVDPGVYK